jgi:hypothetical protein
MNAELNWRPIAAPTTEVVDALKARVARISTDLSTFIRAERIDAVEAEIMAAMNDLRQLRLQARQMRAEARAERRAA